MIFVTRSLSRTSLQNLSLSERCKGYLNVSLTQLLLNSSNSRGSPCRLLCAKTRCPGLLLVRKKYFSAAECGSAYQVLVKVRGNCFCVLKGNILSSSVGRRMSDGLTSMVVSLQCTSVAKHISKINCSPYLTRQSSSKNGRKLELLCGYESSV